MEKYFCYLIIIVVTLIHNYIDRHDYKKFKSNSLIFFLSFVFVLIIPMVNIHLGFELISSFYTFGLVVILFSLLISILNLIYYSYTKDGPENQRALILITFFIYSPLLILGISSIIFFMPGYEDFNDVLKTDKTFNASVEKIDKSFEEIEIILSEENAKISNLMSNLSKQMKIRNKELSIIQEREKKLLDEIEHYKKISSISQEQSDALVKELNNNNLTNYLLSFLIGFSSSFMVWLFTYYFLEKKRKKTLT